MDGHGQLEAFSGNVISLASCQFLDIITAVSGQWLIAVQNKRDNFQRSGVQSYAVLTRVCNPQNQKPTLLFGHMMIDQPTCLKGYRNTLKRV